MSHKAYACKNGSTCFHLPFCHFWHPVHHLQDRLEFFKYKTQSEAVQMLHILTHPRMCQENGTRPCPVGHKKCLFVHRHQLNPLMTQIFTRSVIEIYAQKIIEKEMAMRTELMEVLYPEMISECLDAGDEFKWHLEHHKASELGVVLPDFEGPLYGLENDVVRNHQVVISKYTRTCVWISTAHKQIILLLEKKQMMCTEMAIKRASLQHEEMLSYNELHELGRRTNVIRVILTDERHCEDVVCAVCLIGSQNGVLIGDQLVCRSCAIDYVASLPNSDVVDDITMMPCIADPIPRSTKMLSFTALTVSLLRLHPTPDEMVRLMSAQARLMQVSTLSAVLRARRETERMCDMGSVRTRVIARLQKLMTMVCPNPTCEHAFDDWEACAALHCEPIQGSRVGYCGASFCGVCGCMPTNEDVHVHLAGCIRTTMQQLIVCGAIPPVTVSRDMVYVSSAVKPFIVLFQKAKKIKAAVATLDDENRVWCIKEMMRMHVELRQPWLQLC
jgi:hypothetical protein